MKYMTLFLFSLLMILNNNAFASVDRNIISKKLYNVWKEKAKHDKNTTSYGVVFWDMPYKTLPILPNNSKSVIYNLNGLDCYTFVESTIAGQILALSYKKYSEYNENFRNIVNQIRFVSDSYNYADQLHYASDWLYHLQELGLVTDITKKLGGIPYKKKINFISSNVNLYNLLLNNSQGIKKIKLREKLINNRRRYYIPTLKFSKIIRQLQEGDIILFTSTVRGLDVAHMGLVTIKNDIPYLFEASKVYDKVTIDPLPIENYLAEHPRRFSGVIIARLKVNAEKHLPY